MLSKILRLKGHGISILVPYYCSDPNNQRAKNWSWLLQYWKKQLPGSEIIMGTDLEVGKNNLPFSQFCGVNLKRIQDPSSGGIGIKLNIPHKKL